MRRRILTLALLACIVLWLLLAEDGGNDDPYW
jgi:hypothetical protein